MCKEGMASTEDLRAANDVWRARKVEHVYLWDQSEEQNFPDQSKLCNCLPVNTGIRLPGLSPRTLDANKADL